MRRDLLYLAAYAGCFAAAFSIFSCGGAGAFNREFMWATRALLPGAVTLSHGVSVGQIKANYYGDSYARDPITGVSNLQSAHIVKILIVPGHEPATGGTGFGSIYERDVVVDVADALAAVLMNNPHYQVMVARTKEAWNPVLAAYFAANAESIRLFEETQTLAMHALLDDGSVTRTTSQVPHNRAEGDARVHLYGINKWASENAYDIVLHLHLNDYGGRPRGKVGTYDGFTVYVPDHQYKNGESSKLLGDALAVRLNAYHATSTLPKEDGGVAEDQELIATGANNSVSAATALIEYGYIYEPQFQSASTRGAALADYAYQTYLGLQDFFDDPVSRSYGSVAFPYEWDAVSGKAGEEGAGVYALQAALHHLGYYPPAGRTFSECPVSGKAGSCTREGIGAYQAWHGLSMTGMLGPQTRRLLEKDFAGTAH